MSDAMERSLDTFSLEKELESVIIATLFRNIFIHNGFYSNTVSSFLQQIQ
jgi:hypothetical protein